MKKLIKSPNTVMMIGVTLALLASPAAQTETNKDNTAVPYTVDHSKAGSELHFKDGRIARAVLKGPKPFFINHRFELTQNSCDPDFKPVKCTSRFMITNTQVDLVFKWIKHPNQKKVGQTISEKRHEHSTELKIQNIQDGGGEPLENFMGTAIDPYIHISCNRTSWIESMNNQTIDVAGLELNLQTFYYPEPVNRTFDSFNDLKIERTKDKPLQFKLKAKPLFVVAQSWYYQHTNGKPCLQKVDSSLGRFGNLSAASGPQLEIPFNFTNQQDLKVFSRNFSDFASNSGVQSIIKLIQNKSTGSDYVIE